MEIYIACESVHVGNYVQFIGKVQSIIVLIYFSFFSAEYFLYTGWKSLLNPVYSICIYHFILGEQLYYDTEAKMYVQGYKNCIRPQRSKMVRATTPLLSAWGRDIGQPC